MNKLIVDEVEVKVENLESILEFKQNSLCLICKGNNKIILNTENECNLKLVLLDDSFLDICLFSKNKKGSNEVIIEQNNNTEVKYRECFTSLENHKEVITNKVLGKNNKSNIKIRCISFGGKVTLDVLADVKKNTKDNDITEDVKGITYGGTIEIKPNMEINTHEVVANHFVTIASINEQDLFYLESKGLSKEASEKLILDGFIKSIMMDEEFIKDMEVI